MWMLVFEWHYLSHSDRKCGVLYWRIPVWHSPLDWRHYLALGSLYIYNLACAYSIRMCTMCCNHATPYKHVYIQLGCTLYVATMQPHITALFDITLVPHVQIWHEARWHDNTNLKRATTSLPIVVMCNLRNCVLDIQSVFFVTKSNSRCDSLLQSSITQ